jgi:hypothetical protein
MTPSLLLLGCVPALQSVATPKEFDALVGRRWSGTLTYVDYSRNKPVDIPSELIVTKLDDKPRTWKFEIRYPNEPEANSYEFILLSADGKLINDEIVTERRVLNDRSIVVVTTKPGKDNDQDAKFTFTYSFAAKEFSIQKQVRVGDRKPFIRNTYRWKRA